MILGLVHAFLTLFTKAMHPTNPEVLALNKSSHSHITKQTTLWASGIGFHLSHSIGMFIFGLFYFAFANGNPELILSSVIFSTAIVFVPLSYLLLSIKYWFILPTIGIGLACVCFILGLVLIST